MPKEFYTEKDIEDLFHRGIRSLQLNENVVLTELAYEKAQRLNFQLITDRASTLPATPVHPSLSETPPPQLAVAPAPESQLKPGQSSPNDIEKRIRSAV